MPDDISKTPGGRPFPKIDAAVILAVFGVLAVASFAGWRARLDKRYEAMAAELATLEDNWSAIAKKLPEAERTRRQIQELLASPKRLEEDRTAPRWTGALRAIAAAREGNIELQDLHASQMEEAPGACELRIDGFTSGPEARIAADRFRQRIEQELQQGQNSTPVKTGFLRLAELPESTAGSSKQQRVTFEIVATVGLKDPAIFKHSLRF